MNALTPLFVHLHAALSPLLGRLGLTLLQTVWQGTLAAGGLWVALAFLRGRSPQTRCLAGCAAALAMMVAMVATFVLLPASDTLSPSRFGETPGDQSGVATDGSLLAGSTIESGRRDPNASRPQSPASGRQFPVRSWPLFAIWCEWGATLLPLLALAWAAAVLILAGRLMVGCAGVRRLRQDGTSPVGSIWEQSLADLARRMRIDRVVSLRHSTRVGTPTVLGWLRPIILLPLGMCARLSTAQVEMILAHELAHVERRDYLVNLLLNVAEIVLFYHPAMWWIGTVVRDERENACDDRALAMGADNRAGYVRALASLEEMRLPGARLALAARGGSGSLLARVRRLLGAPAARGYAFPSRNTACGLAATLVLSGVAAAVFTVAGLTPARSQESVNAASKPAEGAPSLTDQSADDPEPAREQLITHVKVTDGTGRPVAGATVSILGIRRTHSPSEFFDFDETLDDSWQTDGQGDAAVSYPRYTDEKHPIGTLHLLVKHPDFSDRQADWNVDGEQPPSKPVPLAHGAKIRVRGHLPDVEGGTSRPTIYPELVADKFDDQTPILDLPTADWHSLGDNEWESSTIPPGDYHLRVDHANADGTVLFSEARQITAIEDKTYAFDLEPQRGGRIEGRLDDTVPRPVIRGRVVAHVYAMGPGKGAEYLDWDTWRTVAPDGTFVFESLPPGTAEITVHCAGFTSANPPGVKRDGGIFTAPQSFAVSQDSKTIALVRMEPTASVEVEVRNEAGQPVSGVKVRLMSSTGFTPVGLYHGFYDTLGREEDAVAAGPNVKLLRDQANPDAPSLDGRTDGVGRVTIHDVPEGDHMMFVDKENYEWLPPLWHGQSLPIENVELAPGETKHMVEQVRKKGTDPLKDSQPASTPASSPVSGPTPSPNPTPAPSPAASATPTPGTELERAWEEYRKVDAEVTQFDREKHSLDPGDDFQATQKLMAGFLSLMDRYHKACVEFVRLAPKEDPRRPLVLLFAVQLDIKATRAERTAVVDEILATPTAPAHVQARALALGEDTPETAAKIAAFLASHPQEPSRRVLESKAAKIREEVSSSPAATPEPPAASPSSSAAPSPELKDAAVEEPQPDWSAAFSRPGEKVSDTASPENVTDDSRSLLDLYKKRGYSIPESFIDERIATTVHNDFNDDRAAFLQAIQAKGFTEASFRNAKRESIIVQAMRQRLEREAQDAKAQALILPKVQVRDRRLADTIELLATEVRRLSPEAKGINVHLDPQATQAFRDAKITLDLTSVSLLDVLREIAQQTHGRYAKDQRGPGVAEKLPE